MPQELSRPTDSTPRDFILVVGDWVIDEYWFLVRHHSRSSSRTGFLHYRLSSEDDEEIIDLCGAGQVARVLCHLSAEHDRHRIVGLGNWSRGDTEFISHLLHARGNRVCRANSPGFQLAWDLCDTTQKTEIYSLTPEGPTNRVIRQYHREHGGIEQISRVDWESSNSNRSTVELQSLPLPTANEAGNIFIAVTDLRKGVVTPQLIESLLKLYPKARWCVQSKEVELPWLEPVKSRLELLVVGPELSVNPWDKWISNDTVSLHALEVLAALPGQNVVLTSSDRREVVAHFKQAQQCITARSLSRILPMGRIGLPSAIFAALTNAVFRKGTTPLEEGDLGEALRTAESLAEIPLAKTLSRPHMDDPFIKSSPWQVEEGAWWDSRKDLGLVKRDGRLELDVWRGATSLPDYITCIRKKEEIIDDLGRALREFKNDNNRHSGLNIMIHADPGAGKTFLAKCLARTFNFSLLRFNITQMIHRDDLLELFDSVATRQANEAVDLLVFVDEINATLDASPVYSTFLSPLEEGYYVRRGSSFSLKPCVWLFAGTGEERESLPKSSKFIDFESRMTIVKKMDFRSLEEAYLHDTEKLQAEARLEQVYLGALMIHRFFPDVTEISESVLRQFHKIDPKRSSGRRIRHLCASLKEVQYGKVSRQNCEAWSDLSWDEVPENFIRVNF